MLRATIRLRMKGFTITELMIAMLLGLLLGAATLSVFLSSRNSFDRDDSIQRMQDDARQTIRMLANDLSMAGYWSDAPSPASITLDSSLAIGTDCGPAAAVNWIYRAVDPGTGESLAITSVDNATGAAAQGAYSCIDDDELEPGTDVVAVKRVAGAEAPSPVIGGRVYLRTNGTLAMLYREPEATPPAVSIPAPFTEWEYRPSIFYVRKFADRAGDGVPTLCRKKLTFRAPPAEPTMTTECLARGIENLQIEFGLDPDGDGRANYYVADPSISDLQTAVSARIFALARSSEPDQRYTNEKTYLISNSVAYTPNDNFYRRVFSITVSMHNLRNLQLLRS